MGRKRKVDENTLVRLFDEYYINQCKGNAEKIKYTEFACYVSECTGVQTAACDVRRCKTIYSMVKEMREKQKNGGVVNVIVTRNNTGELEENRAKVLKGTLSKETNIQEYLEAILHSKAELEQENIRLKAALYDKMKKEC